MAAYYNENDPVACAVLKELIHSGEIANGHVDERPIQEVHPDDIRGYDQCHLFAGAGIWSAAAAMAGWPGDRQLWTASCPCQPFSVAGRHTGVDDSRHLWPHLFRLVRAVKPAVIVGEQVGGKAGYGWFDGVCADLEGEDYSCRAVDIPACAVNAPHQRQRLYWVALADSAASRERRRELRGPGEGVGAHDERAPSEFAGSDVRDVEHPEGERWREGRAEYEFRRGWPAAPLADSWCGAERIICADGKTRRTEPGIRLLVDGMAGRVDLWRLAGNSIVAPLAAEVLAAVMES